MTLNYKTFGQGTPIIILHGLFGTLDNWQTLAKQFAENHTVFIIDQRNHGRSPHEEGLTYELMAEDLQEFMEDNWIHSAHIIGHSMGGKTAMNFALEYPDMVDKLVIVDIGVKQYVGGHQAIFEALFSIDFKTLKSRKEADAILSKKIPDFGVRQFLLKNLTRDKEGGYRWKMNLSEIHKHYQDILAGITADQPFEKETLFINGGKSKYIQQEDWASIQALFPNSNLETIPNVGHWIHAEAPKEFMKKVTAFLET